MKSVIIRRISLIVAVVAPILFVAAQYLPASDVALFFFAGIGATALCHEILSLAKIVRKKHARQPVEWRNEWDQKN